MARIHRLVKAILEADPLRLPDQRGQATAVRKPAVGLAPRKPIQHGSGLINLELPRITRALQKVAAATAHYPGVKTLSPNDKQLLKQASDRLAWVVGKLA